MRNFEGERLVRRAISITTGSIMATTPTLFKNADIKPALSMIAAIKRASPLPAMRNTCRPILLAIPLRASAPLMMKTAQTVMTAGLLKPESASVGVTRPVIANVPKTIRAMTSTRMRSLISRSKAPPTMINTCAISGVNGFPIVSTDARADLFDLD